MKAKIHPKYEECVVTCACGNTFTTRSTVGQLKIEICGSCHPFFTGKQKYVDTAGRVEKFQKRYGWGVKKEEEKTDEADAAAPAEQAVSAEKTAEAKEEPPADDAANS